jgi:hypothetical protein
VLRRQHPQARLQPADRALLAAFSRLLPRPRWSVFLVQPETLLGWHRRLVADAWTCSHRQTGRPPLDQETHELIVQLAREDPTWGRPAKQGRAARPGLHVSATVVRSVLRRHGLDPPANLRVVHGGQPSRVHRRDLFSGPLHEYHRRAARTSFCTLRAMVRSDGPDLLPGRYLCSLPTHYVVPGSSRSRPLECWRRV